MANLTPSPSLVVGAVIVDDLTLPTTMLTGRRTEPPELAGRWELPGGKVEPGEQPREALHREILEELGVQIELGALVAGPLEGVVEGVMEGAKEGGTEGAMTGAWPLGDRYVMWVWLARVTVGEPRALQDHDRLRVLTKAELYAVSWLPADLPIIAAVGALMG